MIDFRSDFFSGLLNTNFREGSEKSATLPLSTPAAEQFIRFLYGFELDNDCDIDTIKDLIAYGGVCGLKCLQDAVATVIEAQRHEFSDKNTLFDILDFVKKNNAELAVKICIDSAVLFFSKKYLLKHGHLARHPDIAVKICEEEVESESNRSPSPFERIERYHGVYFRSSSSRSRTRSRSRDRRC